MDYFVSESQIGANDWPNLYAECVSNTFSFDELFKYYDTYIQPLFVIE